MAWVMILKSLLEMHVHKLQNKFGVLTSCSYPEEEYSYSVILCHRPILQGLVPSLTGIYIPSR